MTVAVEGGSPELRAVPSSPAPPQRLIAGRFRLVEQLGRGGMGRVYRATDEVLNRQVAVKLIYDDAVRDRDVQYACALEARAAARLNHPGIVRILDSGFDDGHCYVVMSLAEGRTLSEILREDGPLTVDRALDLGIQVADALAAAHQEGVIHCDVKPGNLLVDAEGRVRLVDFGIARVTSSTTGLTGELLQGSAQYVAPEQVEGASVDGRTDLYALGTVLYEMLAGRTPFGGGTIASILARRLVTDPPSLREINPTVPPQVEQVIFKALARDPSERFQTAADFRDAQLAIRKAIPMFPVLKRTREQTGRLPAWSGTGAADSARLNGAEPGRRVADGAAYVSNWVTQTGRRARELASTALPDAMARAQLLTPTHRPTLRAGVALAMLVGLLMGTAAAKCGVTGVAAETALATEPAAEVRPTAVPAPPVQVQAPAVAEPITRVAAPSATEPPPPTPLPPTATVPAPAVAEEPEPAVAETEPPPAPAPPAPQEQPAPPEAMPAPAVAAEPPPAVAESEQGTAAPPPAAPPPTVAPPQPVQFAPAPAPAPPVRAQTSGPPAPVAPPPPPAAPPDEPPPPPPAPEPQPVVSSDDDDDGADDGEQQRPLSNTPRDDEKTSEERAKAERKRLEKEKRNEPTKQPDPPEQEAKQPEPPKPKPTSTPKPEKKPEPPELEETKPEADKPEPPGQEDKKPKPPQEKKKQGDNGNGNKQQRDGDD